MFIDSIFRHFTTIIGSYNLTGYDLFILALGASMLGIDKAGLRGVSIISIPLFANYFGGKVSTSIVLPFLLTGDICAFSAYRRKIQISLLKKMMPFALIGLTIGMFIGKSIPDSVFRYLMASTVLVCLILMVIKEFGKKSISLPDHWLSHATSGFAGGFSTMIGNAAGPIMAVYLLSLNLPKELFIGTGALFFFLVNLIKLPIHIGIWETLNISTIGISLLFIPCVLIGFVVGLKIVRRIPDRPFRIFIIFATLIGTVRLFFI